MSGLILNLKREEMPLLEGKVGVFEVQEGCPEQCVICGANAGRYNGSMDWDDYTEISDGIAEIRRKYEIELFNRKRGYVYIFDSSNPPKYHSKEGSEERTLYNVANELYTVHKIKPSITIAGWKPGDNYMQHAMGQIVDAKKGGIRQWVKRMRSEKPPKIECDLCYSVKTVGNLARADYLKFLESLLGSTGVETVTSHADKIKEHTLDFLSQSLYARQLTENMRTLKGSGAAFSIQYIHKPESLPTEYRVFEYLFSREYVRDLFSYCEKESDTRFRPSYRGFAGLGRAHTLLGLELDSRETEKELILKKGCDPDSESPEDGFVDSVRIEHDGSISILLDDPSYISSTRIPKELFDARSEHYRRRGDSELSRKYAMLANLQGRNLLEH